MLRYENIEFLNLLYSLIGLVFLFIYTKKVRISVIAYILLISVLLSIEGITSFSTKTFSSDESIISAYNIYIEKKSSAESLGRYGSGATNFLVYGYASDPFLVKILTF